MKQEIIHTALGNLRKVLKVELVWEGQGILDGALFVTIDNVRYTFTVEVIPEVRTYQLQQVETHHQRHKGFLLLAKRIFPKIKEELRRRGIPYIEANGNAFLKTTGLFLLIDKFKPLKQVHNKGNRAFTKTGLKVLFYLLRNKDAINLTQRALAEKTGVALGNIPQVIDGLRKTGYLIPLDKNKYLWENRAALLEQWVAAYATELRPRLKKDNYRLKGNWQDITFDTPMTKWGGEAAADILTNYLRPQKLIAYTQEPRRDLMKKYRLIPDQNGEIEVLEMFWKPQDGRVVPPLLVYADLVLEGGKRNMETAEMIYHEHIQPDLYSLTTQDL